MNCCSRKAGNEKRMSGATFLNKYVETFGVFAKKGHGHAVAQQRRHVPQEAAGRVLTAGLLRCLYGWIEGWTHRWLLCVSVQRACAESEAKNIRDSKTTRHIRKREEVHCSPSCSHDSPLHCHSHAYPPIHAFSAQQLQKHILNIRVAKF